MMKYLILSLAVAVSMSFAADRDKLSALAKAADTPAEHV